MLSWSLLGGSQGLVLGPRPLSGDFVIGAKGQPAASLLWGHLSWLFTEKLAFSGLILLGPAGGRMLGPGQRQPWCQEPPWRESWGGALSHGPAAARWFGWVGTLLSPIPVSPQRAPSFRLSHKEGEKL